MDALYTRAALSYVGGVDNTNLEKARRIRVVVVVVVVVVVAVSRYVLRRLILLYYTLPRRLAAAHRGTLYVSKHTRDYPQLSIFFFCFFFTWKAHTGLMRHAEHSFGGLSLSSSPLIRRDCCRREKHRGATNAQPNEDSAGSRV